MFVVCHFKHVSCTFIAQPAAFNLLHRRVCPSVAVTNILTAERKTGQSTTVSPAKVMTKMWNEYEDKWHKNPMPRGNIPTSYGIYSMFMLQMFIKLCFGYIQAVFILISSVYDEHYNTLCLTYICSCMYLMCPVYNRCSCLFINTHKTRCWLVISNDASDRKRKLWTMCTKLWAIYSECTAVECSCLRYISQCQVSYEAMKFWPSHPECERLCIC